MYLDGANGVGGKKMRHIKKKLDGYLDVEIFNAGGNGGKLNLNVSDNIKIFIIKESNHFVEYNCT